MSNKQFDQRTTTTGSSTKDVAADEAKNVAKNAQASGTQVADTAKGEAQQLIDEAKGQAQGLFEQLRSEATSQASTQQQRLGSALRTVSGELDQMAHGADSNTASSLVSQAAGQVDQVATWLESREPADLLHEVRRYARRNPGTFLAGAALLGLVGGRLTRGLQADAQRNEQRQYRPQHTEYGYTERTPGYAAAYGNQGYVGTGYAGQAGYVEQAYTTQGGQGYPQAPQTGVYDQQAQAVYGTEYPTAEGRGYEQRENGDVRR